jgi:hypothetical protein
MNPTGTGASVRARHMPVVMHVEQLVWKVLNERHDGTCCALEMRPPRGITFGGRKYSQRAKPVMIRLKSAARGVDLRSIFSAPFSLPPERGLRR